MRKTGPDLQKAVPAIQRCRTCRGQGFTKGVLFELDCTSCDGTGWIGEDGMPVEPAALIRSLGRRLIEAEQRLVNQVKASVWIEENNRRGPGGSHFTGD
ncbi:hypothetical protein [Pseudomonas delhiensis]|uniref:hypothetical protein n=1 Tax=Pseudomonas delhiensis TaxID=366289 RepID=UPI00315B1DD3